MKNILLMFLSDGKRPESAYKIGDNKIVKTRHSNESAVYELAQTCKIDMIFAFASKLVMESQEIEDKKQTTLEYFQQRVAGIVAPENIVICPYDEAKNMNTALTDVGAMAERILEERKKYADEEYTLHADMTGGMRNASMMMLGVMRLLEYSQIKMGRVLYSNWERGRVEDSADVYRFFDLVAGAKEFVNYGSVIELNNYFAKEKETSAELKGLLSAMENFSESIKLCQYGEFKKAIRKLGENIELFLQKLDAQRDANDRLFSTMLPKPDAQKDANDRLFYTMLPIIKKSYEPLLASDNDLEIIDWCIKRGYLQQAMTLYTERVPEFIFDKGLLAVSDQAEAEIEDAYKKFLKDRRGSRSYYIIAAHGQTPEDAKFKKIKRAFLDVLKKSLKNRKWDSAMVKQDLDDFVNQEEIRKDCEILWSHEACEKLSKLIQSWRAALGHVDEELAAQIQANALFEEFLERREGKPEVSFDKKTFYAFVKYILNNASPDVLEKTFAIELELTNEYMAKVPRITMKRNLDKNVFVCAKGIEASLLDAIDDYKWVRDIRNSSNHARNDKGYVEPSDVKDRIQEACERLKEMEKIVNAAVE